MDRLDVIYAAADALRAQAPRETAGLSLLQPLLDLNQLKVYHAAASDPMLGGAIARLWLHMWDQPDCGGIVWLRAGLSPQRQAFAIAHELGHLALHRGEGIPLHPACAEDEMDEAAGLGDRVVLSGRVEEYSPRARREQEASAFAAELLAPRTLVRRDFLAGSTVDEETLAATYGISPALARRRLADAVLVARVHAPAASAAPATPAESTQSPLASLDASQAAAARANGPALVVAGPGSGKTKTLIARLEHLIVEQGIQPESVLALTYSNKTAGELRERLMLSGLPGERVPVMTIHAFAAMLLRGYARYVPHASDEPPLRADFRIIDQVDGFLLLEELLTELPLRHYRSLGNPTRHLSQLLTDFSRARDTLLSPADYLALVEKMPLTPETPEEKAPRRKKERAEPSKDTFTAEQIAKARERAHAYGVWDRALRRRGLVEFGGLIQRTVELLRARPNVLTELRGRYPHILVDEFQDTNAAAAELLLLLAGARGTGLWVVGDRHQSIHRWRGASPSNLPRLAQWYPALNVHTLRVCYRSVPAIVHLGIAAAARMTEAQPIPLPSGIAATGPLAAPVVLEPTREPLATPPPVLRCETYGSRAQECAGVAAAVHRRHAEGIAYRDQAVLCRTGAQVARFARALAAAGIPASQRGGLFEREEVKDALALFSVAVGPDAGGLLRAPALLAALKCPPVKPKGMRALLRAAVAHQPLPQGFDVLLESPEVEDALTEEQRAVIKRVASAARALHDAATLGDGLGRFLLLPGGYAWQVARVADGLDAPRQNAAIAALASPAASSAALAALGALLALVQRFDQRWHNEEDFRERLSRVVRRAMPRPAPGAAAQPEVADALELPPSADTLLDAAADPTAEPGLAADVLPPAVPSDRAVESVDEDESLAVACFLHYLRALRSAEEEVPLPPPDENAVQVMTIHASKGLEFPIVYVPSLAAGQFPSRKHGEDPAPPGFREDDSAEERMAEERCLFYVAITRARDSVALTRATAYGSSRAHPSPLLALLDECAVFAAAPPLHTEDELAALPLDDPDAPDDEAAEDDDNDAPPPPLPAPPAHRTPEYHLYDLEQYLNCPRQYKYARYYRLQDPAFSAGYRFHLFVRRGLRELRDLHREAPAAGWEEAEQRLRAAWEEVGPAGHAYDAFYWSHAEEILRDEWARLTDAASESADVTRLAEHYVATLPGVRVRVSADRVRQAAPDTPDVLVRLHTGRPRDTDQKDLTLPLLYLAYTQHHPNREPRIHLAYVSRPLDAKQPTTLDSAAGGDGSAAPPELIVDVTDEARTCAIDFEKANRRRKNRLDKLLGAAAGIAAGRFEPRPERYRCAACAFCTVCPADPDSLTADDSAALVPDAVPAAATQPAARSSRSE
jgi:DNA helicase-2/ATP-dependent DNA helicase PcrA